MQSTTAVCLTSRSIQLRHGSVFMALASILLKSALELVALFVVVVVFAVVVVVGFGKPAAKLACWLRRSARDKERKKLASFLIGRPRKGANIITGSSDFKITKHFTGLTSGGLAMASIISQLAFLVHLEHWPQQESRWQSTKTHWHLISILVVLAPSRLYLLIWVCQR